MKKMLLTGVAALALIGISVGGTWFIMNEDVRTAAVAVPESAAAVPSEIFYHSMQPEFVVNLPPGSPERFLMVEVVVATHEEDHLDVLERHAPELRNELLTLFGSSDSEELRTEAGKLDLRLAARARVDELLAAHDHPAPVEDIFLTRFVMQ